MLDLNPLTLLGSANACGVQGGNNEWSRRGVCAFSVPWLRLFAIVALSFHSLFSSSHLSYAPRPTYSIFVNSISQVCNQACRAAEYWTPQITAAWIAAIMQGTIWAQPLLCNTASVSANIVLSWCHTALVHWVKAINFKEIYFHLYPFFTSVQTIMPPSWLWETILNLNSIKTLSTSTSHIFNSVFSSVML